jgi:predicted nuclease of restriction endonuclease-like (RecB) superfamily
MSDKTNQINDETLATGTTSSDTAQSLYPENYENFISDLKKQVEAARVRAALSVNREMILLYWSIGRAILEEQAKYGWGSKVIDNLASDLKHEFPEIKGFSPRNLKYMRALALAYPEESFVQQLVAQIPWGHNVRILDSIREPHIREFYIQQTIANSWSRNVLVLQIESNLFQRQGYALNNFDTTLPSPQNDLAEQILKAPYNFDFLSLSQNARERELELGLINHIQKFLLELGQGFAFVGRQYHLEIGGNDYYLDLLFYHLKLRCFVVIDLKMDSFKPEYAGKMNFYLSAVDDLLKHAEDKPSIGLILCKSKDKVTVEYALRGLTSPLGVAGFSVSELLPTELKTNLPSIQELERELQEP